MTQREITVVVEGALTMALVGGLCASEVRGGGREQALRL